MNLNLPHQVRLTLYLITVLMTPVVLYLFNVHIIGPDAVTLWGMEVTAVSGLAAFNVKAPKG